MARLKELFDGGLVTARDPISLAPGELILTNDVLYHPNDPAPQRVPARTTATTSGLGAAVTGLQFCAFDFVRMKCVLVRNSTTVNAATLSVPGCSTTGAVTLLSTTNSFVGVKKGVGVSGHANIQAGTTVASVDSPTQVTLSLATTGAVPTTTLVFANETFNGVSVGARVLGPSIPDGTTVATKPSSVQITLSAAPTESRTSETLVIEADDLLLAQTGSSYETAVTGAAGTSLTFSTLESVTAGDELETVHYENRHYILNGKNENRVLLPDGRSRKHGLLPVKTGPALATSSGTWALISGAGYYAYWTTEYDKVNDLESTWEGGVDSEGRSIQPPWVHLTSTSLKVTATRPDRVNASATHWRLYRSTKMDATTDQAANKESVFPNGYLVGTFELRDDNAQIAVDDGGGVSSVGPNLATAVSGTSTSSTGLTWTGTGNIFSNNAVFANLTWASGGTTDNRFIVLEAGTFAVSTVSAPITGIKITVRGKRTGNGSLTIVPAKVSDPYYSIYDPDTGGNWLPLPGPTGAFGAKGVPLTVSNADQTVGSANDLWGRKWDVSDFADGKFVVRLFGTVTRTGDAVDVDSVSVQVFYGETQGGGAGTLSNINKNDTEAFKAVTVTPFDFEISVGRDGVPPKATTGCIFQNCLLTNDVSDGSLARYSAPTRPDSFPQAYVLDFDTQAVLTKVVTMGAVAIAGFDSALYRINYLPLQTDAAYDPGRAVEEIEGSFGIPTRKCATVFTLPGGLQTLFYVNRYGAWLSDGYRNRPATQDIDWKALVDITNITKVKLVNNPELHLIEMYFVPTDAASTTYPSKVMFFHYHASHLKDSPLGPMLKVSGPTDLTVGAACRADLVNGLARIYTGQTSGSFHVQYENIAQGSGNPTIQTRFIEANGPTGEWRVDENYLAFTQRDFSAGSPGNLTVDAYMFTTDAAVSAASPQTSPLPAFAGAGATFPKRYWRTKTFVPEGLCEAASFRFALTIPGTERLSLDYTVFEGEPFGQEESV